MTRMDLRKKDPAILFAHITSLFMGLGLLVWGVAPAFVNAYALGGEFDSQMLMVNSMLFLFAMLFIGLSILILQRVVWATWASFALSTTIVFAGVMAVIITKTRLSNAFVITLSVGNCLATWMAIGALARMRAGPRRAAHST